MTLNALVSTVSSRTRCEAGEPAQKGEQSSAKLQMKALAGDLISGVPRKDFG